MPIESIAQQWVFSCDCCGTKEARTTSTPSGKWIGINIDQRAVDMSNNPCADASVALLLCRTCGVKATDAMNKVFADIRAALTGKETK
jgi:hypothetical protein